MNPLGEPRFGRLARATTQTCRIESPSKGDGDLPWWPPQQAAGLKAAAGCAQSKGLRPNSRLTSRRQSPNLLRAQRALPEDNLIHAPPELATAPLIRLQVISPRTQAAKARPRYRLFGQLGSNRKSPVDPSGRGFRIRVAAQSGYPPATPWQIPRWPDPKLQLPRIPFSARGVRRWKDSNQSPPSARQCRVPPGVRRTHQPTSRSRKRA